MKLLAALLFALSLEACVAHDAEWRAHHHFTTWQPALVCAPSGAETVCTKELRPVSYPME